MNEHDWFNINRTQIMTDLSESKIVSLSGTSATLSSYVCNSDVVVIQGKVLERGVNEVFHGPLYIPRGQTSFDIAQDSELPILLVLQSGSDNEDEYKFGPHFGDWRKSVVDYDNVSEVTLSSGTSHEKPSYKNVEQYYHCSNCSVRISRSSISINSWSPGSETQVIYKMFLVVTVLFVFIRCPNFLKKVLHLICSSLCLCDNFVL
uniref:Uncharacterized protein n=1 Tax=Biomphalaria glabrata TaxID=6526 RepID=A0A2C9KIT3_BIOGL